MYQLESQQRVTVYRHEDAFVIAGQLGGQAFALFALFTFVNWLLTRNLMLDELAVSVIRQQPKVDINVKEVSKAWS